ncbi:hypothetical protein PF007_g29416, partial [Phytophthora fragariae]
MAMSLIKLSEVKRVVARLEYAKQVLQQENSTNSGDKSPTSDDPPPWAANLTYDERKTFLKAQRTRYSRVFQRRAILEETKQNANASSGPESKSEELPETPHRLQKEATSKLHSLLMLNLFRSCCCWLAENMLATEEAVAEEDLIDSGDEADAGENTATGLAGDSGSTFQRNSVSAARLLSAAGAVLGEGMSRRRSSIKNTRRVLETYHQGFTSTSRLDPDGESMNATYAASAGLLFEEERRAAQEAELDKLSTAEVEIVTSICERNPVTGQLETPPTHVVSVDALPASEPMEIAPVVEPREAPRNRKKEELQRAMMHRKLHHKRYESSESDSDGSVDSQQVVLPVIHGAGFHFGNFVAGDGIRTAGSHSRDTAPLPTGAMKRGESPDPANIESMWKRGGTKLTDGTAPSIKEVLAHAHRLSSREKLRSGSRRPAVVMKDPPELSPPEESISETQPAPSPPADKRPSPLRSGQTSPVNVTESFKRRSSMVGNRRPLGRAASMSCVLPGAKSTPTSPALASKGGSEQQLNTEAALSGEDPDLQEPAEVLVVPAVQIITRSLENLSSPVSSTSTKDERSPDAESPVEHADEQLGMSEIHDNRDPNNDTELADDGEPTTDVDEKLSDVYEAETTDAQTEETLAPPLQSPIVEISTSRTSQLPGEGQRCYRHMDSLQTLDTGDSRLLPNDSLATSVSAFIKWEEAAALEAFPLAVVPSNHPHTREKGAKIPRVRSIRVTKQKKRHEEADELAATKFVLDDSTDWTELSTEDVNEVLALHGKVLAMAKKTKRVLQRSRSTDAAEFPNQFTTVQVRSVSNGHEFDANGAPLVRPISVTVVTKPARRELEAPEPVETLAAPSTPELPTVETLRVPLPKPFVKLEGTFALEKDQGASPPLQLKGLGLGGVDNSKSDSSDAKQSKLKSGEEITPSASKVLQSALSVRVPARHSRRRAPKETPSSSSTEFTLRGARLTA